MKFANLTETFLFHITPEVKGQIDNLPKNVNLSAVMRDYLNSYLANYANYMKEASIPPDADALSVSESVVKKQEQSVPVSEDDEFTEEIIPRKTKKIKSEDEIEEISE